MEDKLINDNIFNRCIFKKATKEEMKSTLEYYTTKEDYEKCMIIKELINLDYFIDDPLSNDISVMTKIINEHKKDLDYLSELKGDLNIENVDDNDNTDIMDEIDNISDIIINNILNSNKLRIEYIKSIYDDITNIELPPIKKEKHIKLIKKYREDSIKNLKNIIDSSDMIF